MWHGICLPAGNKKKERKAAEQWVGVTGFKSVVRLHDRKKKETIRFLSYVRHLSNSGLEKAKS